MRKLHIVGLALFAVFAFGAMTAASASAAGGPEWIVTLCEKVAANTGHWLVRDSNGKCLEHDAVAEGEWETKLIKLAASEVEKVTSEGENFILRGTANIECPLEIDKGTINGGNPGTDETTLQFTGCHVVGDTVAECGASNTSTAGEVLVSNIHTLLAYPQGKPETTTEAYDAFVPSTENTFVEFTLTGTKCGLLNNEKVKVKAIGTEVKEPAFNKNCGVLAKLGKLSGGVFVGAKAGEEAVTGALQSLGASGSNLGSPTEAEQWESGKKVFLLIECKLEALGSASEVGTADVTLESEEEYGWEV